MSASGEFKCSDCKTTFKRLYDLRKHVKKFREGRLDKIAPLKSCVNSASKTYNFVCDVCKKNFNYKKHLTYHKKRSHGLNDLNNSKSAIKCPLCSFNESSKTQLYTHFKNNHNIEVCFENFEFSTKNEFEAWKNLTEQNSKSRFVKEYIKKYKLHTTVSYICSRSGFYKSVSRNQKHLKTQGSRKIGGFCPSGMKVVINSNGQCQVTYNKIHVGHTNDLGHLNLTTAEREEIATKIALKIPFSHILDEIRDKISEDSIQRIHLLTKKDLNNIAAAFNLQSEAVRHPNDAVSIEAWVNAMQQSECVLFYKPQDSILNEYPELKSEDFVLIIMNEGQSQMLEKFSSDCVCIDGTHGLNAYNFELHTLLVLDDMRQGFPTAFLVSNRSDQEMMTLFFSVIKEKIGFAISPKIFMSDMANAYYNAWREVMNVAELRLFCTWHVDRAWRKNLNAIKGKEKQVEVYKTLRTLLQETNKVAFLKMLEQFLNKTSEDPDTFKFATYFKDNYVQNAESWAYCFRLHSGINTNMHLERMHKTIKYIYLEGKHNKRLDKSVSCIMRFVKDKLFDRIITLNKGKICSKLKDLRKRHKIGMKLDVNLISEVDDRWQILSSSPGASEMYTIYQNLEKCDCQLVCSDCKICMHKYSCSCLDSAIRWNMCKHIHLLGRKLLDKVGAEDKKNATEIDGNLDGDGNDLLIHIDPRNGEAEDLFKHLLTTSSSDPINHMGKTLQQKKEEMKRWFGTVVDSIQSDSHFDVLKKIVAPLEPTLKAAKDNSNSHTVLMKKTKIPHNKKIQQQRRLFSTKKKTKKNSQFKRPETQERNQIAVSLLNNGAQQP